MNNRTEVIVLLDRSGSMQSSKEDHEGGLRSFVDKQRNQAGDVRFTLIQFDDQDPCDILYDGVPLDSVRDINLDPRGCTPLLDAIGRSVAHAKNRFREYRPDHVLFIIVTDGLENASREWTKTRIRNLIRRQEDDGWKFVYLGANVDVFAEAGGLGVRLCSALAYGPCGPEGPRGPTGPIGQTYNMMSAKLSAARGASAAGKSDDEVKACYDFSAEERVVAMSGTDKGTGAAAS